jgi:hypothetical protein
MENAFDGYIFAVGEIAVNSSGLEDRIKFFIGELIGNDIEMSKRLLAGEMASNLLRIFETLFRYRIQEESKLKDMKKLVNDIEKSNRMRNRYVHAVWIFTSASTVRKENPSKINGIYDPDIEVPTIAKLRDISRNIKTLTIRLYVLMKANSSAIKHHKKTIDDTISLENKRIDDFLRLWK